MISATHSANTMTTTTDRGQFFEFLSTDNLMNLCLSGEYSSATGKTFVYYMRAFNNKHAISDTRSKLLLAINEDIISSKPRIGRVVRETRSIPGGKENH